MRRYKTQVEETESEFQTNPKTGLTSEQAAERMRQGLCNTTSDQTSLTTKEIIRSNVFTYFNLIFFIIAAVLLYEGSYNNMTFLGVVFCNTIIGIVQEIRSKHELEKLQLVNEPETFVLRDGKKKRISSERLVRDDIIFLTAGKQICADAVICKGTLRVNESLLTGEADEVLKNPGDRLLSGSFVVSGKAKARLTCVGDDSFAAALSKSAKQIKKRQQPGMMKSLTRLIQVIGILIIPFAVMMFRNQYFVLGLSEKVSIENTAAAVIGMIPEGLYLLTSIALAASTVRLAKRNTLVHDMKCIETLARVDVICVDKTGTITEPQMRVAGIFSLTEKTDKECETMIRDYARCMEPDNETMKAIQKYFGRGLPDRQAVRVRSFSSESKYGAVDFGNEVYLLGAPDFLVKEYDETLKRKWMEHSSRGERVLLFAVRSAEAQEESDIFRNGDLGGGVQPAALVVLENPVRKHAKETFGFFTEQDVAIKVISGDSPVTAAKAAQEAGIPQAEKYIDVSLLDEEKDIAKAAGEYTVFGRVKPEQKRKLIQSIRKNGHTVAMTGDGVNDVLALKDADCGIAMASGSEAAANVADLVLLDSDFSSMPQIVAEGRRVIHNIERSASLFLVKNIFSFVLSLISLISVSLYPLKPAQISLASAYMIGIPSFFLALEPNNERVKGKFLRNVFYRALPAALTSVIVVEWSIMFADAFSIPTGLSSTVAFFLYSLAAYLMLYRVCKPMNWWHGILFGTMGAAFIVTALLLPEWFQIIPLNYGCILILSALLFVTVPLDYILQLLFQKCEQLKQKLCEKIKKSKPLSI